LASTIAIHRVIAQLRNATLMALIGFGIGAAAVVMLRFSASFDAVSIRQLLEIAASSDEG
jgi:hypothetical protein